MITRKRVAVVAALIGLGAIVAGIMGRAAYGAARPAAQAPDQGSAAIVVDWNRELLRIVRTPGLQPATIHPTRSFAIMHAAIYDVVVSITHDGSPYRVSVDAPRGARADAAAAAAAHDTLVQLYPSKGGELDRQLAAELATIPDGAGRQDGIAAGRSVAQRILSLRAQDGSSATPPVVALGTGPGDYRPTPPRFAAPVFTHWGKVTPFVLSGPAQFAIGTPPTPGSATATRDLEEVQSLGRDTSTSRTADQTTAARFWSAPIWNYWNEIAQNAVLEHHASLVRAARVFAALDLTFADGTIAFYDAKYRHPYWRPVTAIRETDPGWTPLVTTPPDPSYPGAHSVISSGGATVLRWFFGEVDRITVSSEVLPGAQREFHSYRDAALEAGLSRIYAGVHTRSDHESGMDLGRSVATYVLHHAVGT